MAYRQLFAVTLTALGLGLAACGGGPASQPDTGFGAGSEQPPASPDRAPGNGDRPPASSDQPPRNPDQPPYNGDQPPGAGGPARPPSGGTCEQFCAVYGGDGACPGDNQVNVVVRALCDDGCDSIPSNCTAQFAAAIACVAALPGLCTEEGPADGVATCGAAYQAAVQCDDDGQGPGPMGDCTQAADCVCGGDMCRQCTCAGVDQMICDAICQ